MAEKLEIVIDVSTAKALKQTADLARATDRLSESLDDTSSAADKVADALDASTAQMVADMKAADKAAEALSSALGPELAAKIGTAKLDDFLGKLRSAGLSFEEIEGGATRFADSLRQMDAATGSFDSVEQAARRTNDEMGKSKGVLANFVGNAAQELPGLSGAFGPLNTAIGQFAEYAAEGDVNLSQFLKAAGPVAAIGIGFAALTAIMGELGRHEKAVEEQAKKLVTVQEKLADAQYASAAKDLADQYGDLIGKTAKYGISTQQVVDTLQGGSSAIDILQARYQTLTDEMASADGRNAETTASYSLQVQALFKLIEQLKIAQEAYGQSGDEVANTTVLVDDITTALANNAAAAGDATSAQARHTQEVVAADNAAAGLLETEKALTDAYLHRNQTLFTTEQNQLNLDNTYADLIKSDGELMTVMADSTKTADEKAQALRDLRLKQIDAAQAVMDSATAYSDSQGAVEGSSAAIAIQIEYLKDQQKRYPELSSMIGDYIANLQRIPSDVTTQVKVIGGSRKYATGTNYHPGGVALVGELGPELVDLPRGSRVHTAAQTRSMARIGTLNNANGAAPAGGIVVNVLSADPRQVVEAIRQYEAQNGSL